MVIGSVTMFENDEFTPQEANDEFLAQPPFNESTISMSESRKQFLETSKRYMQMTAEELSQLLQSER